MVKKILLLLFLISSILAAMDVHFVISVTNSNDSGPCSLREAVAVFNRFRFDDRCQGIRFIIPGLKTVMILLETDILIQEGVASRYFIETQEANQHIFIHGNGSLIFNAAKIRLGSTIFLVKQPKSLVDLAIAAVARLPLSTNSSKIRRLPIELKERISQKRAPDVKRGCNVS